MPITRARKTGPRYYGGSRIAAPDGSEPAVIGRQEGLIVAELDRAEVNRLQRRLPYLSERKRL